MIPTKCHQPAYQGRMDVAEQHVCRSVATPSESSSFKLTKRMVHRWNTNLKGFVDRRSHWRRQLDRRRTGWWVVVDVDQVVTLWRLHVFHADRRDRRASPVVRPVWLHHNHLRVFDLGAAVRTTRSALFGFLPGLQAWRAEQMTTRF